MESFVKNEWGYSIYMSGLSRTKRGVTTLINNNFDQEVTNVIRDPNGNFLILEMYIQKQKINLVNIYGPNEDKPQFYKNLKQKINELESSDGDTYNVVICGDWNLVIDPNIDTENYKSINNPNARSEVLQFIEGTSRQRSGKGAIRKRFPLQKPRWEKTKLTIRYLYHETYRKPNEQLFSQ